MKIVKKVVACISAICMMMSTNVINISADATNATETSTDMLYQSLSVEDSEKLKAQSDCSIAYGTFLSELPTNYPEMFSMKQESAEYIYPEDFAGTYFNKYDDNKMTLYLTNFDNIDYYKSFFSDNICHFELAEYSYNDLSTLFDNLSYNMVDLDLSRVSIDDLNNRIEVNINNETSTESFVDYVQDLGYDTNMVNIEYGSEDEIIMESDEVEVTSNNQVSTMSTTSTPYYAYPGHQIKIVNSSGIGSAGTIGYNAYNPTTGQYGIVTAGHVINSDTACKYARNKDDVLISSNRNNWIFYKDINLDAAFIPADSSNTFDPIYFIKNNLISSSTYILQKEQSSLSTAMVNMTVYSFGITTGMQGGTITDMSVSVNNNSVTTRNCIEVNFLTQSGDSGGPLTFYTYENSNRMAVMGICLGHSNVTQKSYFVKIGTINRYLGVTMYTYDNMC